MIHTKHFRTIHFPVFQQTTGVSEPPFWWWPPRRVVLDTFCVFNFSLAFCNAIFNEVILESGHLLEASTAN